MAYYGEAGPSPEEAAALGELRDALPAIEERLRDPAKERRRQATERELEAAQELRFYASRRAGEVDGTDERAREELYKRVRSVL